jgi:hypothetical protein
MRARTPANESVGATAPRAILATRIPQALHRRAKLFCFEQELRRQGFVAGEGGWAKERCFREALRWWRRNCAGSAKDWVRNSIRPRLLLAVAARRVCHRLGGHDKLGRRFLDGFGARVTLPYV